MFSAMLLYFQGSKFYFLLVILYNWYIFKFQLIISWGFFKLPLQ